MSASEREREGGEQADKHTDRQSSLTTVSNKNLFFLGSLAQPVAALPVFFADGTQKNGAVCAVCVKAGESCGVAGESSGLLRWFVEAMMGVWRV